MKKILVVSASFRGGGAERLAVQLANTAFNEGYSVCYFVGSTEGPYKSELNKEIRVYGGNKKKFSNCLMQLAKLLREKQFDAVFCSQEYIITIVYFSKLLSLSNAFVVGREASTPSKNILSSNLKARFLRLITGYVYRKLPLLVAPSQSISEDIKDYYRIQRDIIVLPNFVDRKEIARLSLVSSDFNFKEGCIYLVVVGRLVKMKGIETVIKALASINKENVHLVVLGEGPEMGSLKRLSHTLAIQDNVHFLGFLSNPFYFIKKADIFVLASEYEGMPNSLIQALILDTYVISTNNSEMVLEYLDENCIFEFGNVTDLAGKLIFAIENDYPIKNKCEFIEPKEYVDIIFNKSLL